MREATITDGHDHVGSQAIGEVRHCQRVTQGVRGPYPPIVVWVDLCAEKIGFVGMYGLKYANIRDPTEGDD